MKRSKLTRRNFLRGATATAAGIVAVPSVVTSAALGKRKRPAASERINIGHIGVGNMGGGDVTRFMHLKEAQCVAVCDPFQSRREEKAAMIEDHYSDEKNKGKYKGCAQYGDFREVLARDDIDAVVIATPDHWHVPIALAAARAGKAMYVEKPLGLSIEQNQALRDALTKSKVAFQFGTQQRSDTQFHRACELVRNGRIGEVHTIHAWCPRGELGGSTEATPVPEGFDYARWLGPAAEAPYTVDRCISGPTGRKGAYHIWDYSLGFVAGWGIHPLDIAQWGNNTDDTCPVEYEGSGLYPTEGLFNNAVSWDVQCRYASGVRMRFMSDDVARLFIEEYHPRYTGHGTTFIGSEGWVSVDRRGIYADPPSLLESKIGPADIHLYKSPNHARNLLDCIKSGEKTICPIETAFQGDNICQLSEIAIRTGRKIAWDPQEEKILNDEGASRLLRRAMRTPWTLEA